MSLPYMKNRNDGRTYFGLIEFKSNHFEISVYDTRVKKICAIMSLQKDNELVARINEFFDRRFDGIVVFVYDAKPVGYSSNHEFCQHLQMALNAIKVPYYFFTAMEMTTIRSLVLADVKPYLGDCVLHVIIGLEQYAVVELQYTDFGYKQVNHRFVPISQEEPLSVTKSKILQNLKPVVIIGCPIHPIISTACFTKMFKLFNVKLADYYEDPDFLYTSTLEIVKWIKTKNYKKLTILPTTLRNYMLRCEIGNKVMETEICGDNEELPFIKTLIIKKPYMPASIVTKSTNDNQTVFTMKDHQHRHHQRVIIKIDDNRLVSYKIVAESNPAIVGLQRTLEKNCQRKIPVVAFFDYSSVICIAKENKAYDFAEEWGGLYGNTVAINFEKEKPQFGSNVIIPGQTNMNRVVYDFIKLMSMSPTNIVVEPFWPFSITSTEEHPVLMGFEDFTGARRQIPLDNAMAAILKEHLRAIKAETGKRPKEIGICLIDDFKKNELERIQSQLVECCKLLKISCIFVKP